MKSPPHDDNDDLFEQAMSDVIPLRHKLAAAEPIRTTASPAHSTSEEIAIEFGEELRYLRPGIQASALQKLRRGQHPIEATLDLHGLTAEKASAQLHRFLQQSQASGRGAVRIIHGKGYGSAGRQPVLKGRVHQILQGLAFVLAFCSASPRNGGTGAVDVLLRKSKKI